MRGEGLNDSAHRGAGRVEVLDASQGPELAIVAAGGNARAIVWPGMGAELRSLHRISLEAGGETIELSHPGEAVYYVLAGEGEVVDGAEGKVEKLVEGAMVHVGGGTPYLLRAGDSGMELVGGPAPADHALYESLAEEV